jgi:hypothetical protein
VLCHIFIYVLVYFVLLPVLLLFGVGVVSSSSCSLRVVLCGPGTPLPARCTGPALSGGCLSVKGQHKRATEHPPPQARAFPPPSADSSVAAFILGMPHMPIDFVTFADDAVADSAAHVLDR